MKCSMMLHFIWVFTVCKSTCLVVSRIPRVNIGGLDIVSTVFWEKNLLFRALLDVIYFSIGDVWKAAGTNEKQKVNLVYIASALYV